jgi:hypothetical protein
LDSIPGLHKRLKIQARTRNCPSRKKCQNLKSILFVVFTSFEPPDEKLDDEGQAGDDETQQEQQQWGLQTELI